MDWRPGADSSIHGNVTKILMTTKKRTNLVGLCVRKRRNGLAIIRVISSTPAASFR